MKTKYELAQEMVHDIVENWHKIAYLEHGKLTNNCRIVPKETYNKISTVFQKQGDKVRIETDYGVTIFRLNPEFKEGEEAMMFAEDDPNYEEHGSYLYLGIK